jgi:hypothetical protein
MRFKPLPFRVQAANHLIEQLRDLLLRDFLVGAFLGIGAVEA